MAKFKKGDRVRLLKNPGWGVSVGTEGTVDQDNSLCPWVVWDEGQDDKRWCFEEDEMELVSFHVGTDFHVGAKVIMTDYVDGKKADMPGVIVKSWGLHKWGVHFAGWTDGHDGDNHCENSCWNIEEDKLHLIKEADMAISNPVKQLRDKVQNVDADTLILREHNLENNEGVVTDYGKQAIFDRLWEEQRSKIAADLRALEGLEPSEDTRG